MRTHSTLKQIGDGYQVTIDNGVIDVESTGYLQLKALGQLGLTVDGSGNVAVGHTNPESVFHVQDSGTTLAHVNSAATTGQAGVVVGADQGGSHSSRIDLVGDTTYTDYGTRLIRNNLGENTSTKLQHRGTGDLIIEAVDAADITFETTNTERMVIKDDGKVGLGKDPDAALDIASGGEIWLRSGDSDNVRLELGAAAANADGCIINAQAGGSFADLHFAANGTNHAVLDASGNLGIGTTFTGSATNKLDVEGNASIGAGYISDSAPANGLIVQGNVGIGKNSASVALDVSGSIAFDGYLTDDALGVEAPVYQNIFGAVLANGAAGAPVWHATRGYLSMSADVDWYLPISIPTGSTLKRVNIRMNKGATSGDTISLMLRHNRIGGVTAIPATIGTATTSASGDQVVTVEADTPAQTMVDHNDDKHYFILVDSGTSVNIVNAVWADVTYTRVIRNMR